MTQDETSSLRSEEPAGEVAPVDAGEARITFAGEDHVFIELQRDMSLAAVLTAYALTEQLCRPGINGVLAATPSNASVLVRFDPDQVAALDLAEALQALVVETGQASDTEVQTTIVEIPVLFDDPWTRESLMRFRTHHQTPDATDLEYCAELNGFSTVGAFINAYTCAPWFTTMIGFIAGCAFMYQLVPPDRQLTAPFYLRPRTDTPARTVALGGSFTAIHGVRGPGGYQMLGVTPITTYDPTQSTPAFADSVAMYRPAMITKFEAIDRATYDDYQSQVNAGTYVPKQAAVTFSLADFLADPDTHNSKLIGALSGS